MRRRRTAGAGIAVLLVLLAGGLRAAEPDAVKDIALANAGAVDAKTLQRLKIFAQDELDVSIRTFDAQSMPIKALHEGGQHYAGQMASNDVCLIVLAAPEAEIPMHMVLLPDINVAIVNVKSLMSPDAEVFAQRLERQVMRSAAFLMGLPPSPDPYDVTRNYSSLEDLDSMGRNFCPPWEINFAKATEQKGLKPPATAGGAKPKSGPVSHAPAQ